MAQVDLISYSLADDDGNVSSVPIFIPTGSTLAAIQTFSDSMAAAIDGISGAKIQSASVMKALTLPGGMKANALGDHFVNHGANFGYDAADTVYRHTARIPAIKLTLLTGEVVNTADPLVVTFDTGMTGGFGADTPSDRYGNDLTSLLSALATFRGS
jgi:hypothetical protein